MLFSIVFSSTAATYGEPESIPIDGFFSWYAPFKGGEVITKPFTFKGNELEVNFETSGLSYLTVTVLDKEGQEIEGYKSYKMFSNSVNRKVIFDKDLKKLEGKPIRLKFNLCDCELYSFKFN